VRGLASPFGTVDYTPGQIYAWVALEYAARNSGLLRQIVESVQAERCTREEALCTAVMYLAEVQIRNLNEQIERLSLTLPTPIILPPGTAAAGGSNERG
jgi:hypothetical protein